MASYRLRTEIPAKHLGAKINEGDADVIVFSKPSPEDLEVARAAKGHARIVVDICDPHDYREFVELADQVVTSSRTLAEKIPGAMCIPDPIEGEGGDPHADKFVLGWVGFHTNLPSLENWLRKMPDMPVMVCTTPGKLKGAIPWSPATQKFVYQQCGVMLVPASNRFKSNNRVTQAIHEGCFVIADNIPAYWDLRQYAWVGSYPTGVRWAVSRNDLNDLVREGQRVVREQYSPERVASQWGELLSSI